MAALPSESGSARGVASVAAFVLPLLAYAATLPPTVTLEDSGEFITAAWYLGIPHPPGYPLWCLYAHVFTWLPWGTIAERVHLSSAVAGAGTAWLVYRSALRLLGDWRGALAGALGLAASSIVWSQSVVAEVYSLNAFLSMLLVHLAVLWREDRLPRRLHALALVVGLGMGNHVMLALVALPILVWLVATDPRAALRPRTLLAGGLLLLLGLSVYAYLPLRAAADPPVNVGDPDTLARALAHVRRDVYSREIGAGRTAGSALDVARHVGEAWLGTGRALGWPLALLALAGVARWPRALRDVLVLTVAIALCNTLLLNVLLTAPHAPLWSYAHRVYYLPAHAMAALWLARGASLLLETAGRRGVTTRRLAAASLALAVLVAAWRTQPHLRPQGGQVARNLALDLLDSAPPGAAFLPLGDDVLYPVLYARFVEGLRPDVHLLSREYGWHGEPYSTLLVGDPPSEAIRAEVPALRDWVAVPHGLVHVLVPPGAEPRGGHASFVPLPGPPRDAGLESVSGDLFVDAVRARYAAYHARLGALLLARGEAEQGLRALDRAEALNPGSPHVDVLLFDVYRDLGIRTERLRPLLSSALEHYDRAYDPHTALYDHLRRSDIERRLASLDPR